MRDIHKEYETVHTVLIYLENMNTLDLLLRAGDPLLRSHYEEQYVGLKPSELWFRLDIRDKHELQDGRCHSSESVCLADSCQWLN